MDSVYCDACKRSYKKSYMKKHLQTKKHLKNMGGISYTPATRKTTTNESYGMGIERVICEMFSISHTIPVTRTALITDDLVNRIEGSLLQHGIEPVKHIGGDNKSVDFLLSSGETLSVKSNTNGSKVCPQNIGQTTLQKFSKYFHTSSESQKIKEWVQKNPVVLFKSYFKNLFCCDYVLWVHENGEIMLLKSKSIHYAKLFMRDFTFTRNALEWNESTTLKWNSVSIGEFQIHNHRNCIKFRFHLKNLLKMINKNNHQ